MRDIVIFDNIYFLPDNLRELILLLFRHLRCQTAEQNKPTCHISQWCTIHREQDPCDILPITIIEFPRKI